MLNLERALIFKDLFNIQTNHHNLPWQTFREGVDIYRLYGDGTAAGAALLRYQKGASVPTHNHSGFEHIFVLSGEQTDRNGTHIAGTLVINPPDSSHSVSSESGCIVLAIWEKPVVMQADP
ncbi:cupin domain-containing protein [Tumidithrix helvetica PCC 7403]|uniref:cupin domain-containing protein n=1 Tax=Tumidithrix helvetica TaxID=3457545 RepID=UPI003CBC1EB1